MGKAAEEQNLSGVARVGTCGAPRLTHIDGFATNQAPAVLTQSSTPNRREASTSTHRLKLFAPVRLTIANLLRLLLRGCQRTTAIADPADSAHRSPDVFAGRDPVREASRS